MKKIKDINYGLFNHPQQTLDIYLPEADEFPVFIYFHGGGLENGDKCGIQGMGEFLAERNIAFVSCNYRLYPHAIFPEFLRDAAAAVAWIYNNINNYGKATGFFVGGSSAGGYISMMLCFDKKYLAPHNIDPDNLDGFIHDAGQPTSHFNVLREQGIDSRRVIVDETAPIYFVKENPNYTNMLFIVSDNDMENRYEQTVLMLSTIKHFNGDTPQIKYKLMHGEHCQYVSDTHLKDNEFNKIVYEFITSTLA